MKSADTAQNLEPGRDCALCPRLRDFVLHNRIHRPDYFNAPVPDTLPTGGVDKARLLIVGLAPGLTGANRTGVPFTGDHAGEMLHKRLQKHGFLNVRPNGHHEYHDCVITNAVRCVPPQNKPLPVEINMCRSFLQNRIRDMRSLKIILAVGRTAHDSVVRLFGQRLLTYPFSHGDVHSLDGTILISSYHCSRYNFNTGVLTEDMLDAVFVKIREIMQNHKSNKAE